MSNTKFSFKIKVTDLINYELEVGRQELFEWLVSYIKHHNKEGISPKLNENIKIEDMEEGGFESIFACCEGYVKDSLWDIQRGRDCGMSMKDEFYDEGNRNSGALNDFYGRSEEGPDFFEDFPKLLEVN